MHCVREQLFEGRPLQCVDSQLSQNFLLSNSLSQSSEGDLGLISMWRLFDDRLMVAGWAHCAIPLRGPNQVRGLGFWPLFTRNASVRQTDGAAGWRRGNILISTKYLI